jgi:glycosyltransferase involved in cell wall biosynthesis
MTITFVVPCFNEEQRLDQVGFRAFLLYPNVQILFVDDGSTDGTRPVLEVLCGQMQGRAKLLAFSENQGKGEAVRQGMLLAMREGSELVGYFDADLATPPEEIHRLIEIIQESQVQGVTGARVAMLGTVIRRTPTRHYLGRVFATFASLVLKVAVYDTQCGAKLFRRGPLLAAVLSQPFAARWAFDVELLGRLLLGSHDAGGLGAGALLEVPLRRWTHMDNEKLRFTAFPLLGIELIKIRFALARWRKRRDFVLKQIAQATVARGQASPACVAGPRVLMGGDHGAHRDVSRLSHGPRPPAPGHLRLPDAGEVARSRPPRR